MNKNLQKSTTEKSKTEPNFAEDLCKVCDKLGTRSKTAAGKLWQNIYKSCKAQKQMTPNWQPEEPTIINF